MRTSHRRVIHQQLLFLRWLHALAARLMDTAHQTCITSLRVEHLDQAIDVGGLPSARQAIPTSESLVPQSLSPAVEIAACLSLVLVLLARHVELSIVIISFNLLPILIAICVEDACDIPEVLVMLEVVPETIT